MPLFTPPAVTDVGPVFAHPGLAINRQRERGGAAGHALMRHYARGARYQWVLKVGGVYATYDAPTSTDLAAATEAYSGPTVVSTATATALTAAGYSVTADVTGSWSSLIAVRWDDLAALEWGWV